MAQLIVTALDDGGAPIVGLNVVAHLSDLYGTTLREFTAGGLLVQSVDEVTDVNGVAILDLVPNSLVLRDNTYYLVKVGGREPVLIFKDTITETLGDAVAVAPSALGAGAGLTNLSDVNLAGLSPGDGLRYQGGQWVPWAWPSGGGGGSSDKPWVGLAIDTVFLASDSLNRYKIDAAGGSRLLTLPTAVGNLGIEFTFKRVNGGANLVTVQTALGQAIDGALTFVLTMQWESVTVSSDNANWMVT